MVQDTIQLGVKRPQGKSLSCAKLRGFFNGGSSVQIVRAVGHYLLSKAYLQVVGANPARQHLILQSLWLSGVCETQAVGEDYRGNVSGNALTWLSKQVKILSQPFHNFYDIPSSKRVARCTNILHTGATLSGVGEGQRLRKGCWKYWRRDSVGLSLCKVLEAAVRIAGRKSMLHCESNCCEQGQARQRSRCIGDHFSFPDNLSSAAEIRHSARNTKLWDIDLRFACTHR